MGFDADDSDIVQFQVFGRLFGEFADVEA